MKWIRKVLKGISLTAVMFVFQACYGTMNDYYEAKVTFHVVDGDTGEAMQGVGIWIQTADDGDSTAQGGQGYLADYTDENGMATVWIESNKETFRFIDQDSLYKPLDTVINLESADTVNIALRKQ